MTKTCGNCSYYLTDEDDKDGKGTDLCIDAPVYAIHLCDVKEAQ